MVIRSKALGVGELARRPGGARPGGGGALPAGEVLGREQAGGARGVSGCGGELREQRMERRLNEEGG